MGEPYPINLPASLRWIWDIQQKHLDENTDLQRENNRLADEAGDLRSQLATANSGIDFADRLAVENADAARRLQGEVERLRGAAEAVLEVEDNGYIGSDRHTDLWQLLRAVLAQPEEK